MVIEVNNLVRDFKVSQKSKSSFRLLKNLFPGGESKRVVDHINFSIKKGEFVGYLGSNGAGKSTTIKMLSGVLVPTSGTVNVLGIEPYRNRKQNAKNIGVVFGQRTQLWWDLPLIESFKLLGSIYGLQKNQLKQNLDMYIDILDMESFLSTPVRQLSLGQRMRGDIAASLIHNPEILFLDEPTIGLDLIAKEKIQDFLMKINKEQETTIILTTHNLDDVEKLCRRVIFIDEGKISFDGSKEEMINRFPAHRYLVIETKDVHGKIHKVPKADRVIGNQLWFRIEDDKMIPSMIKQLSDSLEIHNVIVSEPKIEDIIKQVYTSPPLEKRLINE
jgi:ABC-2 type transport system ATP-binding protein